MLVKECFPGDFVIARGWDIKPTRSYHGNLHQAFLVPHDLNHKKSKEAGQYSTLFYVGKVVVKYQASDPYKRRTFHHFLTSYGESITLHGTEFRFLESCKA
jgi:hypothetical protein|tara:strand:+ start:96 stop:398 length:303 start_codon:yes stop_codon:yes gene_type:complete